MINFDNSSNVWKLIKSQFNKDDRAKYLEHRIINILEHVKDDIKNNKLPIDIIALIQKEIGYKLLSKFGLDKFINGLYNIYKLKKGRKKLSMIFIDRYIDGLHDRISKYYKLSTKGEVIERIEDVDSFKKWLKIAKEKPKHAITYREFEAEKLALQADLLKRSMDEEYMKNSLLYMGDSDKDDFIYDASRFGLIEWLKLNDKKLIIVCEGRDSAGKGSFIKTFVENLKLGVHYKINEFGIPTEHDKKNWFERYKKALPDNEPIALFDRSWYNRAILEPVYGYCSEKEYDKFMKEVLGFEYNLIDNGYIIIKLWFSISKETQMLRFNLRRSSPVKYWKYSVTDARSLESWDKYTDYKNVMFTETSTEKSPWVVVDSNDKRLAKLNAMRWILNSVPYKKGKVNIGMYDVYPEIVYPIIV